MAAILAQIAGGEAARSPRRGTIADKILRELEGR
jgi:hypothetical protein